MYTKAVGNSKLSEGQYSNTDSEKTSKNHFTLASQQQQQQQPHFIQFCVSHDLLQDPYLYFDLSTLNSDPSRSIGQYDHLLDQPHRKQQQIDKLETTTKHVQQALTEDADYVNLTTECREQLSHFLQCLLDARHDALPWVVVATDTAAAVYVMMMIMTRIL
ncbi:hypothetical protein ACA910_003066 [Epithemia clementina (nom. ined.)]